LAGLADRVLVLYAGRVAEWGPANSVLSFPQHPYTRALFAVLATGPDESKVLSQDEATCNSRGFTPAVCGRERLLRLSSDVRIVWNVVGKRAPPLIPLNDAHCGFRVSNLAARQ